MKIIFFKYSLSIDIIFQVFFAVNGRNGDILWEFSDKMLQTDLMSVYVSQVINDVDGDNIPDILAVHGGDELSDPEQEEKMFGRLIVFSGKDGKILRYVQYFQTFYSFQRSDYDSTKL